MNKEIWIETYQPRKNPDGTFEQFDVVEDLDFISSIEDKYVWTEIWDFDGERPWLVTGCVLDENGGLSWYVCDKPWESDQILVEWDED